MPQPDLRVASAIEGIAWPGIPAANGAAMLGILFQLEQTQWWPEERLLERQRSQLARLLAHAARQVPFYRERLAGGLADLPETANWMEGRLPI